MTTHLHREYDPQTRKLRLMRPFNTAGTTSDEYATQLHFSYTIPNYPETRRCWILFDIRNNSDSPAYYNFDGYDFGIPHAVLANCRSNVLRYVLVFTTLDEELGDVSFEQSETDALEAEHSLPDGLMVYAGISDEIKPDATAVAWTDFFKKFAFINVDYDGVRDRLTFETYNGNAPMVTLKSSRPERASYAVNREGWMKDGYIVNGVAHSDGKEGYWYYPLSSVLFDPTKTIIMYWAKKSEEDASKVNLCLDSLYDGTAIIRADNDPHEVWGATTIVTLDFMAYYALEVDEE